MKVCFDVEKGLFLILTMRQNCEHISISIQRKLVDAKLSDIRNKVVTTKFVSANMVLLREI